MNRKQMTNRDRIRLLREDETLAREDMRLLLETMTREDAEFLYENALGRQADCRPVSPFCSCP